METNSVVSDDSNRLNRPTLFYDVDGVLLDFTGPFAEYWNKGVDQGCWVGEPISVNPETWCFGYKPDVDDMTELYRVMYIFHEVHEHLPLMHEEIIQVLEVLKSKYTIELVTAYPNETKRVSNLLYHKLPYDKVVCNVKDKLSYIQDREKDGATVVAIFEDGPHHLDKLLPLYSGRIWAPNHWNYLDRFKGDSRIKFYDNPWEWMELNNV